MCPTCLEHSKTKALLYKPMVLAHWLLCTSKIHHFIHDTYSYVYMSVTVQVFSSIRFGEICDVIGTSSETGRFSSQVIRISCLSTMKAIIFTILMMVSSLISCTSTEQKCKMLTTSNDKHPLYLCLQATLNDLDVIPEDTVWLRFSVSRLSHLPERALARFPLLGLAFYNCRIEDISPNAFDGLDKLRHLTLYGCNIHLVRASWFKDTAQLSYLFLDHNNVAYIEPDVFKSIPKLKYLNIEDNNLNCLTPHNLMPLKKLEDLRIAKNPWLCSCHEELTAWMNDRQIDNGMQNTTDDGKLECMVEDNATFNGFEGSDLENISRSDFALKTDYLSIDQKNALCVGKNITILSEVPDNVQSIRFLNSHIPEIPRFAFFLFGNTLKSLDFSNSSVRDIHPDAFAGLPKLERLVLFNNSFSLVSADWFRDFRGLKHLVLDNNAIEHIQPSVFPMLNKLETLSLKRNNIGCFPLRAFASMKYLKDMNMANNTWICSCLKDFRNWMHLKETDYRVLPTQCTDNKMHMNGKQYITGYQNSTFQQDFENEETKIINDNAILASGGTLTEVKPFDGTTDTVSSDEQFDTGIIHVEESYHKRNIETANYELKRHRAERERQKTKNATQSAITGTEANNREPNETSTRVKETVPTQTTLGRCSCQRSNEICKKTSWHCVLVDGDMSIINGMPTTVEVIHFTNFNVPIIPANAFVKFPNLVELSFKNSDIRDIDPSAFATLDKLERLILSNNNISAVRSSWFHNTANITELILAKNPITVIEPDVFKYLPNLESIRINENKLKCMYTSYLAPLKRLKKIEIYNNPWKWRCLSELRQFLDARSINHEQYEIFYKALAREIHRK